MSRLGMLLLLLLGFAAQRASGARAVPDRQEPSSAPQQSFQTTRTATPLTVHLGQSSVELGGLWKFHAGDDPAWAQSNFDDSGWGAMDLTPPPGSADGTLGISGYIPGWTARGYPFYAGFAWYRIKVNVQGPSRRLALKMPSEVDDAYQVFVNGRMIGSFGKFRDHRVTAYSTLPMDFLLPEDSSGGPITIAIRMWMDSATPFNSPDAGGLHEPPVLGYASIIDALTRLDYNATEHFVVGGLVESMILFMALLMTLALFWLDRAERAYLWLAMVCLAALLINIIVISGQFTAWIGETLAVVLTQVVLAPLQNGLWVLFWGYWFRIRKIGLLHAVVWPLVALLMAGVAMLSPPLYGQHVPVQFGGLIDPFVLLLKFFIGVVFLAVVYRGLRQQRGEGWSAAPAALLIIVANYRYEMRLLHIPIAVPVGGGFVIQIGTIATVVSLLIITVMLLTRFFHSQRRKEQWKLEIEQAQQMQKILIPDELPKVPGLTIQSEYRPAREVGGDFFQVLPTQAPGSVLIMLGDVTGKGTQAGMLVAVIVGAMRAAAQHSSDPAKILHEINVQLCDRKHTSATGLILHIDPQGAVTIASAGQLPPYLNDKEMEIPGALPLGTLPDADLSVTTFTLQPGDTLTLMSDGVVEAQDSDGNLFGFSRIDALLKAGAGAAQIATAAQEFGQEDDILVLTVRREKEEDISLPTHGQRVAA